MKLLFYSLIFLSFASLAQDTLTYSKFSAEQYQGWEVLEEKWRKEEFTPFLKKNNIKMDCAKCTSVYAWVVFKCDSNGTTFTLLKSKKCGEELKGRQLAEFKKLFEKIILPDIFLNSYLKVFMGNGLKC